MQNPQRFVRPGFTLIELLVVISIIAVLIALLLPALQGARLTGRMLQSQSNQRGIMLATLTYATENDDVLMPGFRSTPSGWRGPFAELVEGQYLPDARVPSGGPLPTPGIFVDPNGIYEANNTWSVGPWFSPDVLVTYGHGAYDLDTSEVLYIYTHYSASGSTNGGGGRRPFPRSDAVELEEILQPTDLVGLHCGRGMAASGTFADRIVARAMNQTVTILAFFDGHVEAPKREDMAAPEDFTEDPIWYVSEW